MGHNRVVTTDDQRSPLAGLRETIDDRDLDAAPPATFAGAA